MGERTSWANISAQEEAAEYAGYLKNKFALKMFKDTRFIMADDHMFITRLEKARESFYKPQFDNEYPILLYDDANGNAATGFCVTTKAIYNNLSDNGVMPWNGLDYACVVTTSFIGTIVKCNQRILKLMPFGVNQEEFMPLFQKMRDDFGVAKPLLHTDENELTGGEITKMFFGGYMIRFIRESVLTGVLKGVSIIIDGRDNGKILSGKTKTFIAETQDVSIELKAKGVKSAYVNLRLIKDTPTVSFRIEASAGDTNKLVISDIKGAEVIKTP